MSVTVNIKAAGVRTRSYERSAKSRSPSNSPTPRLALRRTRRLPGLLAQWSPVGTRASLPLRGQRRRQTGFPIIPRQFTEEHLERRDLTTGARVPSIRKRHRRSAKTTGLFHRRSSRVGIRTAALQCLLLAQGGRKEAEAEVTALRLISVVAVTMAAAQKRTCASLGRTAPSRQLRSLIMSRTARSSPEGLGARRNSRRSSTGYRSCLRRSALSVFRKRRTLSLFWSMPSLVAGQPALAHWSVYEAPAHDVQPSAPIESIGRGRRDPHGRSGITFEPCRATEHQHSDRDASDRRSDC
jgi:hypothetical protein